MKLLLSADLHGSHEAYRWLVETASERAVPLVLAGDLLGCPDEFDTVEDAQSSDAADIFALLGKATVPVYYIWGNDDFVEVPAPYANLEFIHERRVELGDWNVVGYQHSLPFVGGPHEREEAAIAADLESLRPLMDGNTVFVTHSPAYGVLDVGILGVPAGSPAILSAVAEAKVRAHIHGHIHGSFGVHGCHYNVAASGRSQAVILDVDSLESVVLREPAVPV